MHSTTIKMLTEHCQQAMRWAMDGKPWISEARLDLGVSAHAVLEACRGHEPAMWPDIAMPTVTKLALSGYRFDADQQPPLNLEQAQEGAQIALGWLATHGAEPDHASVEVGLAINANGKACDYAKGAYQAIIDVVRLDTEGDEESEYRVLTVADYKSSWQADESELLTLQRKGQAVVAAAAFREWDILRLEVRNLRTRHIHTMEILNDDQGQALLARWRKEVLQACDVALAASKSPVASPGAGCMGCPYIVTCDDAEKAMDGGSVAQRWVVAKAMQESLRKLVSKAAAGGAIPIEGGFVGYQAKTKAAPAKGAAGAMWDYWHADPSEDSIVGLLEASGVGVTQIRKLAKVIGKTEGSAVEEDFLSAALDEKTGVELVVTKTDRA